MHHGRTSLITLSGHSEQLTKHQLGVIHTSLFMERRVISRLSLSTKPFDLQTAGDHRKVQLNELLDQAYENSLIYKEKTKRLHDSKIKDLVFNIGDRVLLFNSQLKIFSGKLKSRWSGPFTISHVFSKRTASRRVVKKKVTISAANNIIPDPDVALELEAIDIMQALKESKKTSRRQPSTGGSSEGTGRIPGVLDESTVVFATLSDETGDKETDDEFMHSSEYVQTDDEETNDEFVQGDEQVNKDEDEEMINAKDADMRNSDEEILMWPRQMLERLKNMVKDTTDAEINSLLDIKIQSKVPHIHALYQTMHENKSFNTNPANHVLYHALMKALIEDENAMDKGVADTVKNHKRQHNYDNDDDEDHSTRPNQGSKTGKSATAKEPVKELITEVVMDDAVKTAEKLNWNNPEGDHYPFDMSKPLPLQEKTYTTSITNTKAAGYEIMGIEDMTLRFGVLSKIRSKTGKSATAKEPVKELIAEVVMDDAVKTAGEDVVNDDDQAQDTSKHKTYKTLN
nr:reverse transcriptase domain-containing protein [Tanacetum cinerariifolium]